LETTQGPDIAIKEEKKDDDLAETVKSSAKMNEGKTGEGELAKPAKLAKPDQVENSSEKRQPEISPLQMSAADDLKTDSRKRKSAPLNPPYNPDVPFGESFQTCKQRSDFCFSEATLTTTTLGNSLCKLAWGFR